MRKLLIMIAKEAKPAGIYVCVKPTETAALKIHKALEACLIDIPCEIREASSFHVTEIYSRVTSASFTVDSTIKHPSRISDIENWSETSEGDILVAKIDSDSLSKRHAMLRETHGFTFDYSEYKPHITLCVIDQWSSKRQKDRVISKLKKALVGKLFTLTHEESEPLDEN